MITDIKQACEIVKAGGIIAYPTEAVFGLGCDPFNEQAVKRLAALKSRSLENGFILIAARWQHVAKLTLPLPSQKLAEIKATWPGPFTWVFPASSQVPRWISGGHGSVALRLPDHPIARKLCQTLKAPLVSTSANPEGELPARTVDEVMGYFKVGLDGIVAGELGGLPQPTAIITALSGKHLR